MAHEILTKNASAFKRITNHITLGSYHNELAIVLRHLAEWEPLNREKHLQQAIKEFKTAGNHFRLGKNKVFGACVKNNVGLINLGRFKDAHKNLEEARRLSVSTRNKVQTAVIDESRAQVLIAERRFKAAEEVARQAVRVLDKSGHQAHLAEALITHGIALARLRKNEQALFTLQGQVRNRKLRWRVIDAAKKVMASFWGEMDSDRALEILLAPPSGLRKQMVIHDGPLKQDLILKDASISENVSLAHPDPSRMTCVIELRFAVVHERMTEIDSVADTFN